MCWIVVAWWWWAAQISLILNPCTIQVRVESLELLDIHNELFLNWNLRKCGVQNAVLLVLISLLIYFILLIYLTIYFFIIIYYIIVLSKYYTCCICFMVQRRQKLFYQPERWIFFGIHRFCCSFRKRQNYQQKVLCNTAGAAECCY